MATRTIDARGEHGSLVLKAGSFYVSRIGDLWCCFKVEPDRAPYCRAHCVRVDDGRVEFFFDDGRYDEAGKREHTLVSEQPS